jgi:hypothetical protein
MVRIKRVEGRQKGMAAKVGAKAFDVTGVSQSGEGAED